MSNTDFKIVILGDTCVGKSSLVWRLLKNQFIETSESTIGAAYSTYSITVNNNPLRFEIWDTAGQERYNTLAPLYYRQAHVAIITYDLTEESTFERAKKWVKEIKQNNETFLYVLVATKYDLIDNNMHPLILKGKEYAESQNMVFFITSSKTGYNVMNLFDDIAIKMEPKVNEIKLKKQQKIMIHEINDKKNYCCY
jgi:small GTP-binding protein